MEIIKKSNSLTPIDILNIASSRSFREMDGQAVVRGALIVKDIDKKDGREVVLGYMVTDKGVFGGSSSNMVSGIDGLIPMLDESPDMTFTVSITTSTSSNGRNFYIPVFGAL